MLDDPVLRRWLVRRLAGLEKAPPAFVAGQPPYLGPVTPDTDLPGINTDEFPAGNFKPPQSSIRIELPGKTVELVPENPAALFTQSYGDLETLLAAHRFAWVPIAGAAVDPDWVAALWWAWADRFGTGDSGWPWHAYTAAERAINIIDFSRRFGLPGDRDESHALLVRHADIIRDNLEYFGEHYTSNHLSNNGRGLLRIGTAFGRADLAATGAKIMVAEAGRIFGRSGVLREGSTHYHLLLTRNYIDAWLDAKSAGLEQAVMLRDIAERALAVIPGLCLPGGMPLIGDISPDVSPAYLAGLTGKLRGGDRQTWPANLPVDRQRDVQDLIAANSAVSPDKLAEDGWHRFGEHGWQALAFVSPDGWPPMPGHGHQDLGSFELHDGAIPVFVDPGRGTYADSGYVSADMHNCLTIGGVGPVPMNRAYYSPDFRKRIVAAKPVVRRTREGTILGQAGFQHLSGIGSVERELQFTAGCVRITDRISGRGRQNIRRRFCTPHPVVRDGDTAVIDAGAASYRLSTGGEVSLIEITCWAAYGQGIRGTLIVTETGGALPVDAVATLERI
ncbi:MAG: hypothetical protein HOJ41_12520 [Rhodospirillaceae bacterium]|nr:hypothetical protein [Rhodospirillaceae bacterium]